MSANINANVLKNFIVRTIGAEKLTQSQAQRYDIDADKYAEANTDENTYYLDLDEILDDKDLYEQFATMYVEEKDKEAEVNAEKEKEEATKVQDKGESKA